MTQPFMKRICEFLITSSRGTNDPIKFSRDGLTHYWFSVLTIFAAFAFAGDICKLFTNSDISVECGSETTEVLFNSAAIIKEPEDGK